MELYLEDYLNGLQKAKNIEEYDNAWKEKYRNNQDALLAVPLASIGNYDIKYLPTSYSNALLEELPKTNVTERQKTQQVLLDNNQAGIDFYNIHTYDFGYNRPSSSLLGKPLYRGNEKIYSNQSNATQQQPQLVSNGKTATERLRYPSQSNVLGNRVAGINYTPNKEKLDLTGVRMQQSLALQQSPLIRGYRFSKDGDSYDLYDFDKLVQDRFNEIRNDPNLNDPNIKKYWNEYDDVNDLYEVLEPLNLSDNHRLRKSMNEWDENDWKTARDLFINSPKIRQKMFDNLKKYWESVDYDVTPLFKKGGSLQQDYRAWEKEMYDSYKCGGKTKKKSCGGEMKPKKKACGGMKVKK